MKWNKITVYPESWYNPLLYSFIVPEGIPLICIFLFLYIIILRKFTSLLSPGLKTTTNLSQSEATEYSVITVGSSHCGKYHIRQEQDVSRVSSSVIWATTNNNTTLSCSLLIFYELFLYFNHFLLLVNFLCLVLNCSL